MTLDEAREQLKNPSNLRRGTEAYDFTYDPNSPGYPIDTRRLARMSDEELGPLWAQFLIEREET